MADTSVSSPFTGEAYDNSVVVTQHHMVDSGLRQPDTSKPVLGAKLVRPFPHARILSMEHTTGGLLLVYWVDYKLLEPQQEGTVDL